MNITPGMVVGGRYQLTERLGQGGMASVWLAQVIAPDPTKPALQGMTEVALKFLSPELAASPEMRHRFEVEASAPRAVRSPHVVQNLDHGIHEDTPYIVMERLHGEDLAALLQRERILSAETASALFTQLFAGLHAAHQAGIVHRDIKPANIFLTRLPGGGEFAKILDFGIAKTKRAGGEAEATKTGTVMGSLNYMSPEQIRNSKDVDHRSDLWSLAVVLLRALTGKQPFPGTELGDLVLKICVGPLPLPSTIAPEVGLSQLWDEFFEIAFNRDRQARFQTALEMAAAMDRVVHGLPLRAHREPTVSYPEPERDATTQVRASAPSVPDQVAAHAAPTPSPSPSPWQPPVVSAPGALRAGVEPGTAGSGASWSHVKGAGPEASPRQAGRLSRPAVIAGVSMGVTIVVTLIVVALVRAGSVDDARTQATAEPSAPVVAKPAATTAGPGDSSSRSTGAVAPASASAQAPTPAPTASASTVPVPAPKPGAARQPSSKPTSDIDEYK